MERRHQPISINLAFARPGFEVLSSGISGTAVVGLFNRRLMRSCWVCGFVSPWLRFIFFGWTLVRPSGTRSKPGRRRGSFRAVSDQADKVHELTSLTTTVTDAMKLRCSGSRVCICNPSCRHCPDGRAQARARSTRGYGTGPRAQQHEYQDSLKSVL